MPSAPVSRRRGLIALASLALAGACTAPKRDRTAPDEAGPSSASPGTRGADAAPPTVLRVLFIGNSYVYVNNLPGWVQKLVALSAVAAVTVDSVAVGGTTLANQVTTTGAMARIHQGGWTHVVLQGQSVEPLYDPATFEANAALLAAEAKKVGAVPVFYETWARKSGDAVYQQAFSGGTPAAMQARLRAEYQRVAKAAGASLAPAGDAWEKALAEQPAIDLFQADGSHPSLAGTYLAACVFYATFTGHSRHSPMEIPAHSGISDADAAALRGVAEQTVGAPP